MKDRVSLYPGRVKLVPVAGQENTYDMVRADSPTQEGTPLNKDSLLKDATAALYGLGADAVPDDAFAKLAMLIPIVDEVAKRGNCGLYYTTYTGTGSGSNSFTFPRRPLFICVLGDRIDFFAIQGSSNGTARRGSSFGISNITWTGNSVSWASENGNISYQCNDSGKTYYMVVLIDASE